METRHLTLIFPVLGAAVISLFILPLSVASPPQPDTPRLELRAVSSSCYEFSLKDTRVAADGWRAKFRFGLSNCLTLSSFSATDGELLGIVCCKGAGLLCQDQLTVTGSQNGQELFSVSRNINCP